MQNYGVFLKSAREAKSLTLREVEGKTGVSNAYLSQLESGKIKQPSPTNLYKLGQLYGIPYETLMEKVGYPVPKARTGSPLQSGDRSGRLGKISAEEEEALVEYLAFIRSRKGGKS